MDSQKDVRSEVNSVSKQASQTGSLSPPTPNSGPYEVGDELEQGSKNPPGLVHAGGKLTKNDKSYFFLCYWAWFCER